jgi:AcrR family transcriptional regulator
VAEEHPFLTGSDRDRALLAAAELCSERGYGELRVEEIAARAGMKPERFGELFADKEEAVRAAIEAVLMAVVTLSGRTYSPDRSEPESYLLGIEGILELMAANPPFAHVSYVAARQMTPRRLKELLDTGRQLLAAMLERMWEYSSDADRPSLAARAALGGAEAVVRREIVRGRTADLPRLAPDFIYAAAVPFLGQEEALRLARASRQRLAEVGRSG